MSDALFASLIITAYNDGRNIARCLDCALRQNAAPEYEIICVDDASQDDCASVIKSYAANGAIRAILRPTAGGKARALNEGLDAARGEYVIFVDGSSSLSSEAVASAETSVRASSPDLILFAPSAHIVARREAPYMYKGVRTGEELYETLCAADRPCSAARNCALRRTMLETRGIRFEDGATLYDALFTLRAFIASRRAEYRDIAILADTEDTADPTGVELSVSNLVSLMNTAVGFAETARDATLNAHMRKCILRETAKICKYAEAVYRSGSFD